MPMRIMCICGPGGTRRETMAEKRQVPGLAFGRPYFGSRHRWVNVCLGCQREYPALPPKLKRSERPLPGQRSFGW